MARKLLLALLLASGVCRAQVVLPELYRRALEDGVANGAYPAVAVGLIEGKEQGTWFFGHPAPTGENAFEIGAVSEIFAGLVLAQDAVAGKLSLRDSVRKLLPSDAVLGDARLGEVTLEELITHRSGLPAIPPNLFPADADDPYADYGEAQLLGLLANYHPASFEKTSGYSPLDVGLLTLLLAKRHGQNAPELIKAQVFAPLKMTHATFVDPEGLLAGSALGLGAPHWHYSSLIGAAGVRATLPDLLAFLRQNLSPDSNALRSALLLARQPRAQGEIDGVGLGWNVREPKDDAHGWPLVWRASETGGFSAFIGFRTDRQRALVLLSNTAGDLATLGLSWLNDEAPPPAPRGARPPALSTLVGYPGLYRITNGNELTVRASGAGLTLQIAGQPPWRLRGYEDDAFVGNGGAVGVSFMREIDHITGLVLRLGGEHISAERLSARAPRLERSSVAVEAAELARLTGTYQLDANTLIRIDAVPGALTLQMTGSARSLIAPYAPDRFADADNSYDVTFQRDKSGAPVGLVVNLAGVERRAKLIHWR
ncbi:MAG TPA: serine hydrolase domain-containing protein [Rudaea sp.]